MEVAPARDFDFNYTSAPSSPTRLTELYCGFDELLISAGTHRISSLATVPFAWEEKPGVPKASSNLFEDEFSFNVSCDFARDSVPAEDLFQGGIIKTANPPNMERERGRERGFSRLPSSRSRRTRSLSPMGGSDYRRQQQPIATHTKTPSTLVSSTPACSSENGSRKWSFRDLFLFRSASDGRAMDKYPLKKYSTIFRKQDEDVTNSSESGSVSKRRGQASAHERHYNLNRAVSNDMKKRTYLPYRQGILGGLSFNA
ncbi:hypothetical protein L2E82_27069 [Cichorium intybus]|uniref:Uncharacterized protein n=1 Tax=Cichorium intybus TaxID=13427 RepID=A0ACB9CS02_CICIN|nr:hypothetical protein L2E82_27069 [Cichorium intybus]